MLGFCDSVRLREQAKTDIQEGYRLYEDVEKRFGYVPIFNPLQPGTLTGVLFEVVVSAGVLTLILGLVILALYRRRMRRLMRATIKGTTLQRTQLVTPSNPFRDNMREIPTRSLKETELPGTKVYRSARISQAATAHRNAAWAYAFAGGAFAAMAAFLTFCYSDLDLRFNRVFLILITWAWPTVLTLDFLWGRDRRRLGLTLIGYFIVLLSVCLKVALGDTPPLKIHGITVSPFFQPVIFWSSMIYPTLFLLMFLNRSIRAIGTILLVFMIFVSCGYMAGLGAGSMPSVTKATINFTSALGVASAQVAFWLMILVGISLLIPLAWFVIRSIGYLYERKWFSDQVMVFDSIWLFQTLLLWQFLFYEVGSVLALTALASFGSYKLVSGLGLRLKVGRPQGQAARLLLLRTFGFRRRSERLFDQLSARWRYAGPIQLIAAPDLAGHSIDPGKLLAFLTGRLRRRFVIEPTDLEQRLAAFDDKPDPDGRYRVNELFCGDDAWRDAVGRLMERSDLIVMDLRGFSAKHPGCIVELQSLIDLVPAGKTVLLVDQTTDDTFLRQTLENCWRRMADASPNRESSGTLTLLHVGRRAGLAVNALLTIADQVLATPIVPSSQTSPPAELAKLTAA
jgi:hypothetical protein